MIISTAWCWLVLSLLSTAMRCRELQVISLSARPPLLQYMDTKTLKTSISVLSSSSSSAASPTIVGAANYVSLFLWNDLKYSSLCDVYHESKQSLRFFSYTFQEDTQRQIMTHIIPSRLMSLSDCTKNQTFITSMITSSWTFSTISLGASTDCLYGSVFEHFDILIDTPDVFAKRLRFASSHFGTRKNFQAGRLNPNDFQTIPLFPSMVWIFNVTIQEMNEIDMNNDLLTTAMMTVLKQNSTLSNLTCLESVMHDARVFERLHGIVNFTEQDLKTLQLFMNLSSPLNYSYEILNKAARAFQTTTDTTLNQTWSLDTSLYWSQQQVLNQLWPSSCFYCSTSGCVTERWSQQDYLDITVAVAGLFFYIVLFSSRAFLHPSIKRKFGNVYLGPFLIMVGFSVNTSALANHCSTGAGLVFSYCIFSLSLVYIFTMLRFYYLRNTYWIIEKTKYVKIHKVLSTLLVGVVITIFVPLFLAVVLTIPHIVLVRTFNSTIINLNFNLMVLGMAMIPSILGCLVAAFDIFRHRKSIKEKGM